MAKPMLVTFPFALLLLDFWPLGRNESPDAWSRLVLEKVPLFLLAMGASAAAFLTQSQERAVVSLASLPLIVRLENVVVAYFTYIGNMFWPLDLAVVYPHPGALPAWQPLLAGAGLIAVTAAVLRKRKRHPYAAVGWFWYLGTLVPVIGIVVIGPHAVADRYAYIPLIGLYTWLAWQVNAVGEKYRVTDGLMPLVILLLVAAMIPFTWRQIGYWKNSATLWERALAVTQDNARAHSGLGQALFRDGRVDEALFHYRESIRIDPDYPVVHNNLAQALYARGDLTGARRHLEQALLKHPEDPVANRNLGILLLAEGQLEEAVRTLRIAVAADPDSPETREVLAQALMEDGRPKEAETHLRHALRYPSSGRPARLLLARSLLAQNKPKAAVERLLMLLREAPEDYEALGLLGEGLVKINNPAGAVAVFERQLKLKESAEVRNNLGIALASAGRLQEAVAQASEAVRMAPDNEVFRSNLKTFRDLLGKQER
jgi:tetratricopeptide (TPR) repeat protein